MRYIVQGESEYLRKSIPSVEFGGIECVTDVEVLLDCLILAGRDDCVFLWSDVSLCDQFCQEIEWIIERNKESVIQFYSENDSDLRLGSQWVRSGIDWNGVCFYMPNLVIAKLIQYIRGNSSAVKGSGTASQWAGKFLAKSNIKYFNVCPNLVDLHGNSVTFGKQRQRVTITCQTDTVLALADIESFQRGLKKRNQKQVDHLVSSILLNGFSFPLFVWKNGGVNNCLDGHGRILALKELERRGYVIPDLPVVIVEADNEKEARKKLIEINSVNGTFSKQGLLDFIKDLDIDYGELALPGIDLSDIESMFKVKYDPTFDVQQVTDDDVNKASQGIQDDIATMTKNRNNSEQYRDFICPKCTCEFSIAVKDV
ncbi:MAG: ParB N-terminal domain-containing protein [Planctomycetaceae bacterium]|jgi:hypothetical protein|nr:ParB N-terminal domain-containing protein [Planctomycetaceae bacterium]